MSGPEEHIQYDHHLKQIYQYKWFRLAIEKIHTVVFMYRPSDGKALKYW